jgi:hypothetical protein
MNVQNIRIDRPFTVEALFEAEDINNAVAVEILTMGGATVQARTTIGISSVSTYPGLFVYSGTADRATFGTEETYRFIFDNAGAGYIKYCIQTVKVCS